MASMFRGVYLLCGSDCSDRRHFNKEIQMNTKLSALLGLYLIGLTNVSFAESGAAMDNKDQGSMTLQKMDKDHMDQGAMKPATKSKAAMDNGMMKSDVMTKGKTKTTSDNGMMSDTKPADQMDQGSMQKTH
jgi:hypothetical protein